MKNKNNKNNRKPRSMKGRKGTVGAPSKPVNWPTGPFSVETLANRNKKQCVLSLRVKIDKAIEAGEVIQLKAQKQRGGGVGRPKARFVRAEHFDANTMEKLDATATVPVAEVAPTEPTPAPVETATAPVEVAAVPPQPVAEVIPAVETPAAEVPPIA